VITLITNIEAYIQLLIKEKYQNTIAVCILKPIVFPALFINVISIHVRKIEFKLNECGFEIVSFFFNSFCRELYFKLQYSIILEKSKLTPIHTYKYGYF
jgi:hypothetical protein